MPITRTSSGTMYTGPDAVNIFRLRTLHSALGLELKGMRLSRGPTAYSRIKREFGLKGNRESVYRQFHEIVVAAVDALPED